MAADIGNERAARVGSLARSFGLLHRRRERLVGNALPVAQHFRGQVVERQIVLSRKRMPKNPCKQLNILDNRLLSRLDLRALGCGLCQRRFCAQAIPRQIALFRKRMPKVLCRCLNTLDNRLPSRRDLWARRLGLCRRRGEGPATDCVPGRRYTYAAASARGEGIIHIHIMDIRAERRTSRAATELFHGMAGAKMAAGGKPHGFRASLRRNNGFISDIQRSIRMGKMRQL